MALHVQNFSAEMEDELEDYHLIILRNLMGNVVFLKEKIPIFAVSEILRFICS